jgi:hypothetical protein
LKGILIVDQVKRGLLFFKMAHMEERKAAENISWVMQVWLLSFYK